MAIRTATVPDVDDDEGDFDDLLPLPPGFVAQRQRELAARIAGRKRLSLSGTPCGCKVPLAPPPPRPLYQPPELAPVPRTGQRDEEVCAHEAGHAVACLAVGVELTSATVEPTYFLGRCQFDGIVYHGDATPYQLAVISLAGPLAEREFSFGAGVLSGGDADTVAAANLSDRARALAEGEARRIVELRAGPIRTLARELQRRRTMTGDEVRHLLRPAAW